MPLRSGLPGNLFTVPRTATAYLLTLSQQIGTDSPDAALRKFWEIASVHPLATTNIGKAATIFVAFGMLATALEASRSRYKLVEDTVSSICQWLSAKFIARLRVPETVQLHRQILDWMVRKDIGINARALVAGAPHARSDVSLVGSAPAIPDVGWYWFVHRFVLMTVQRRAVVPASAGVGPYGRIVHDEARYELVVSCWAPFAAVGIGRFLMDIQNEATALAKARITIHKLYASLEMWDIGVTRAARHIDTVILDETKKREIVQDVETYLRSSTKAEYARLGIPWRRGLLFYGPPGTGKSSLVAALASHFNLPIYVLGLTAPGLNDRMLEHVFQQLPSRCIVLMEDVDSAGIRREDTGSRSPDDARPDFKKPGSVTLSALLNVLDGVYAAEGRITIMTTNHLERLDEALIRDGRIDSKIELGYATPQVAAMFFKHIFGKKASTEDEDFAAESEPGSNSWKFVRNLTFRKSVREVMTQPEEEEAITRKVLTVDELEEYAQKFAAAVPQNELTPAELQSYLLRHRTDAAAAVNNAAEHFRR